ncbi:MAG TPA: hypothetical protein VGP62_19285 [Bryobacteraceae bacterium]|nr:hypothetical protein [Bryobacteraceae bacterium]
MKCARSLVFLGPMLASVIWAGERGTPMRLQISVQPGTLRPGDRGHVDVRFLGRRYEPVANDVPRSIHFAVQPMDGGADGTINAPTTVPAGVTHFSEAWIQCRRPGRLQISATSPGLIPANTIVVGVPRGTSRLENWLFPRVYANSSPQISILPKQPAEAIPANGYSPATFKVILDRPVRPGEEVSVLLTTSSQSQITYDEIPTTTSRLIPIKEGNMISDDIRVSSNTPANMQVVARLEPSGATDRAVLRFAAPTPTKVFIDPPVLRFVSHQQEVEATVGVADADHVPIHVLKAAHPIQLSSPSDHGKNQIVIDPQTLTLLPQNAQRSVRVSINAYPPNGQLDLQAEDLDKDLDPCLIAISIETPAQKVGFLGPRQARTSDRELQLLVQLLDSNGKNSPADWDTLVQLHSDRLSPRDKAVTIEKGRSSTTVTYTLPSSSGRASVMGIVDGAPSDENIYNLAVVTALYALVLAACIGGALGALTKLFAGDKVRDLMPTRKRGHLNPGLLGGMGVGGLLGTIVFLAFELGLFRTLGIWPAISNTLGDSSIQVGPVSVAFLVGFLGGYGGHSIIDRLVQLPNQAQLSTHACE